MLDLVRRLLRIEGQGILLRHVVASRACGKAGRQAAAIADRVFSTAPDVPLHAAITIRPGHDGNIEVRWTRGPEDLYHGVAVSGDHLFDDGMRDMEEAARWVMGEELRRVASVQAGPGHEDPVWGVTTSPLIADILASMRIEPDNPATRIDVRIARAIRQRGGVAEMRLQGHHLTGEVKPRAQPGRPWIRIVTAGGETDQLHIWSGRMPDTVIEALPGRTLSAVVDLGPSSAGMTVIKAEQDGFKLMLDLAGDATPLTTVPDGVDRRWIGMLGKENASG